MVIRFDFVYGFFAFKAHKPEEHNRRKKEKGEDCPTVDCRKKDHCYDVQNKTCDDVYGCPEIAFYQLY